MTQGLQASLFTQGHKSISGEAFKINCLLTLSFPFFFWPPSSPTSTHEQVHTLTTYYGGLTSPVEPGLKEEPQVQSTLLSLLLLTALQQLYPA